MRIKKHVCDDCGYSFNPNSLDDNEKLDFIAWAFGVPFSIIGVCLVVGASLAGVLDRDLACFGVLFTVWPASPSFAIR